MQELLAKNEFNRLQNIMKWMSHQRIQSEKHDLNKSSSSVFFGFGDEVLNEIPEQNEEPTDRIPEAAEKEESPVIPSNSSDREKHHKNSIQPSTTKSTRETDQMSAKGQEKEAKEVLLDISSKVPFNFTPDNEDSDNTLKKNTRGFSAEGNNYKYREPNREKLKRGQS